MGNSELLSFFPVASDEQIEKTKRYMESYRKAKKVIETFPHAASEKQKAIIRDAERAVGIILDEEVRRVIEFRYIQGNSHKTTIQYFTSRGMSESTVGRRITEGLASIANTLVFCGVFEVEDDSKRKAE